MNTFDNFCITSLIFRIISNKLFETPLIATASGPGLTEYFAI